jgi:hypothetical protein
LIQIGSNSVSCEYYAHHHHHLFQGGWGKRGWDKFHGSWGKRDSDADVDNSSLDDYLATEGLAEDEDNEDMKRAWSSLKGGWGKRAADWVNFRGQFSSLRISGRLKLIPNDLEDVSRKFNTRRIDRKHGIFKYAFDVGCWLQEPDISRVTFLSNTANFHMDTCNNRKHVKFLKKCNFKSCYSRPR